jgi:hypothetical protein
LPDTGPLVALMDQRELGSGRKRIKLRGFQNGVVHLRRGECQASPDVFGFQIGKILRISFSATPAASISSTSLTRMRIPRMQGRPSHCSGSKVDAIQVFHRGELKLTAI